MIKNLSPADINRIKTIGWVSSAGVVIGILFANIAFGFTTYRIIKGAAIGFLITSISSAAEIYFFPSKLKRLNFSIELFIRSLFYILVVILSTLIVVLLHESMEDSTGLIQVIYGKDFNNFLHTDFIYIFIFAFFGSFILNFIWQINKMLGKGRLINLILGKYRRPKIETRVFMFLDLKSSTTLGEKLGADQYSRLLQDFFYDLTDPVLETKGEVYQYIGDEVVLTWKEGKVPFNEGYLKCYFGIKEKINERKEYYTRKYGIIPEFKAGVHIGEAVVTEVGDFKKEIVFHGDVLNTASRIQAQCNVLKQELLISHTALEKINTDGKYSAKSMGIFKLRGKEKEVELFAVSKSN
jgi:adenylate cyclase